MIAKFRTEDGWAMHQCENVRVFDEVSEGPVIIGSIVYGHVPCEDEEHIEIDYVDYKCAVLTKENGSFDNIYYQREAYLMNDQGDTICSL